MTLLEGINLITVSKYNKDNTFCYIAYVDKDDYDTTCYDDDFDVTKILNTVAEKDLNKQLVSIELNANYAIKYLGITYKIPCDNIKRG